MKTTISVTTVAQQIGSPIDRWPGNCYLVVVRMLTKDIVMGELVTGYYHEVDSVTDHSWIKLPDGCICDPTRFQFENAKKPYIFIGVQDDCYDENGIKWSAKLAAIKYKFWSKSANLSEMFVQLNR